MMDLSHDWIHGCYAARELLMLYFKAFSRPMKEASTVTIIFPTGKICVSLVVFEDLVYLHPDGDTMPVGSIDPTAPHPEVTALRVELEIYK